ncbi:MAG: FtsX-like permease family protein [bacterium]|nr:FtsX-like permease family protein [bacterium]MBU1916615.1 FtsX-like permease family protein [bacterium]
MTLMKFLIKRYLFTYSEKNLRAWIIVLSSLGIFIASCLVLISLGVLSGYQRVYKEAILGFSSHLIIYNEVGLTPIQMQETETYLAQKENDFAFSPYHFYEALAPGKKGPKPIIFKGIDPQKKSAVYPMQFQNLTKGMANQVFVGADLIKEQPEIKTHGILKYLVASKEGETIKTSIGQVPVQGTFNSGYYDFDSRFVLMPMSLLTKLFLKAPQVSGYEIRLHNLNDLERIKTELKEKFFYAHDVLTWDELNESLLTALMLEKTVVFAIAFLVLMIACLNIFGFNFLFFAGRKKDFMILSALGMANKHLRHLLALMSFILGGVAVLVGSIVALLVLTWLKQEPGIPMDPTIYYVNKIPVFFEYSWFFLFFAGALILCYLTSVMAGKVLLKRYLTANLAD